MRGLVAFTETLLWLLFVLACADRSRAVSSLFKNPNLPFKQDQAQTVCPFGLFSVRRNLTSHLRNALPVDVPQEAVDRHLTFSLCHGLQNRIILLTDDATFLADSDF